MKKNVRNPDRLNLKQMKLYLFKDWGRAVKISITFWVIAILIGCTNIPSKKSHLDHRQLSNEANREVQKESDKEREMVKELKNKVAPPQAGTVTLSRKTESYLTYQKAQRFLDRYKPRNYIDNKFEDKVINGGKVVIDRATGLIWQQSGSDEKMVYKKIKNYIDTLNLTQFAGYSDWRLPTLDESVSLLEQTNLNGDLYINPSFNKRQTLVWTSDLNSAWLAWVVHFSAGGCSLSNFEDALFVRAVRGGEL